jgi:hypothetical protein
MRYEHLASFDGDASFIGQTGKLPANQLLKIIRKCDVSGLLDICNGLPTPMNILRDVIDCYRHIVLAMSILRTDLVCCIVRVSHRIILVLGAFLLSPLDPVEPGAPLTLRIPDPPILLTFGVNGKGRLTLGVYLDVFTPAVNIFLTPSQNGVIL